ncbi:AbrB family transcriptional regulator [Salipiger abyssi]|uniref:AbrB family transcriptional regulator n=1 Tax=Salipiger abyssi TaxID=1250539 RepID=UPI001A9008D9|nr:AbrB family transcriptional regulator [Salipiger abyssi]MBN9887899.1 AbrB family transcriptional regulator [Salipiger abyssi]
MPRVGMEAFLPRYMLLLLVFSLAAAGGAVADALGLPLAWMIGAMVVSAGFAWAGVSVRIDKIRSYGLVVLGLSLGQSFTPEVMAQVAVFLPLIAFCALATLLVGLLLIRLYTRGAGLDPATAFFCAVPGGVVLMAVQAQRAGASEAHVTLSQTVRLAVVVLIYPFLLTFLMPDHAAGAAQVAAARSQPFALADLPWIALLLAAGMGVAHLARYSFLPNPWMIAPCLLAIVLQQTALQPVPLPHWVILLCQLILGVSLGARMSPEFLRSSMRLVMTSVLASVLLTAALVVAALVVSAVSGLDRAPLLFGMSPGGMPEMTVAAGSLGVSVPLVLSFHLTRILIANLTLEPLWHLLNRRLRHGGGGPR